MSYIVRTGNLAGTPELKTAQSGRIYTRAGVIVNDSQRDEHGTWSDVGTQRYNVTVFGDTARELIATAKSSGNVRILFAGSITTRQYQRADGSQGTSQDVIADEIGVSLTGQSISVERHSDDSKQ